MARRGTGTVQRWVGALARHGATVEFALRRR
jgi:hypothetical protein